MANNYKQYKKAKKEKNLARSGQVAGGALAATGGTLLGMSHLLKKGNEALDKLPNPPAEVVKEASKRGAKVVNPIASEGLIKNSKNWGIGLTAAGTALAGYSTVKAQRAKRKLKELTEDDRKKN